MATQGSRRGWPTVQHARTEGDSIEVWWYHEKGPRLVVWENPYASPVRRWEVKVYPTADDFHFKREDWYHDAWPTRASALTHGRGRLGVAVSEWRKEHPLAPAEARG